MTKNEIQAQIKTIDNEYERVAKLLAGAQRRWGNDMTDGVADRNARTIAKRKATLARLAAKAEALEGKL